MFKRIMVGLLRISAPIIVVAMLGTEASAGVSCQLIGGFYKCQTTGSVNGLVHVTGGNTTQYVVYTIAPSNAYPNAPVLVLCWNGGLNLAPGVNAFVGPSFPSFSAAVRIPKNGQSNEKIPISLLQGTYKDELDAFCQEIYNNNASAANAVPCAAESMAVQSDNADGTSVKDSQNRSCYLPVQQCDPMFSQQLTFDKKTGKFNEVDYTCNVEP